MRALLTLGCAAALIAVAACNRGAEEAPATNDQAQPTATAGNAAAPIGDVAAFMHDRHERYEEIGDAMKSIGRELKSDSPSLEAVRRHAALIARYAPQVVTWFPPGTGPETGRETRAKAEIWQDFDTFRQRAQAFEREAARFSQVAQGNDVEAIRAAQRDLGNACRNCHDRFRAPEDGH